MQETVDASANVRVAAWVHTAAGAGLLQASRNANLAGHGSLLMSDCRETHFSKVLEDLTALFSQCSDPFVQSLRSMTNVELDQARMSCSHRLHDVNQDEIDISSFINIDKHLWCSNIESMSSDFTLENEISAIYVTLVVYQRHDQKPELMTHSRVKSVFNVFFRHMSA